MNRAYAHIRARPALPCGSSMLGWSRKQAWMESKATLNGRKVMIKNAATWGYFNFIP